MWRSVLPVLCFIGFALAAVNPKVCPPGIPASNKTKNFPDIPDSFRAKFSWNMMAVNTTYYVEEVFSEELNIGTMTVENLIGPAIRSKMYTYAQQGQYIFVENFDGEYGGKCNVSDLMSSDFTFPFRNINGKSQLLSGKDALSLGGETAAVVYAGTDTIDDIDVDVWNVCLYLKDTDVTMNATYYFTLNSTDDKTWKTASGAKGVIKRIRTWGDNSAGTNPFDMTYQYVYFSPGVTIDDDYDLLEFEVPLGSYCPGKKTDKTLPDVPNYFTFYMEVYDPQQDLLTYTDEYYDFNLNLTRMDHEGLQNRDRAAKPVKMIHDYQTGLSYQIDKYTGTCTISQITGDQFDNVFMKNSTELVRMRNPTEFFDFEDNDKYPWVYTGTYIIRDISAEVWISYRPYPTSDSTVMAYWEWYFSSKDFTLSNGNVLERYEPIRLVVSVPDLGNQITQFNLYMFNQEEPSDDVFSVAECFNQHRESRSFEFIIRANVSRFNLDTNVGMFKFWTTAAIEAYAGVRSLRVHAVEFEFSENFVFTRFTIVGKANIQGNVKDVLNETSIEDAEKNLISAINTGNFMIYYLTQDGKETQFVVDKESFARVGRRGNSSSIYYVIDDDGKDGAASQQVVAAAVSSGGAAALAIIMFVVGVVIVGALFYFLVMKKNDNLESYSKSQLTMQELQD